MKAEHAIEIRRDAKVSFCGRYRYTLGRRWHEDKLFSSVRGAPPVPITFVMLNPSTADAHADDPTIRRCISFAKREGFEWLRVINLFAGRATNPANLFQMEDPMGPDNLKQWQTTFDLYDRIGGEIVCAWGANPKASEQARLFIDAAGSRQMHCLGVTKDGSPRHPLYIKSDFPLQPFPEQTND